MGTTPKEKGTRKSYNFDFNSNSETDRQTDIYIKREKCVFSCIILNHKNWRNVKRTAKQTKIYEKQKQMK